MKSWKHITFNRGKNKNEWNGAADRKKAWKRPQDPSKHSIINGPHWISGNRFRILEYFPLKHFQTNNRQHNVNNSPLKLIFWRGKLTKENCIAKMCFVSQTNQKQSRKNDDGDEFEEKKTAANMNYYLPIFFFWGKFFACDIFALLLKSCCLPYALFHSISFAYKRRH